MTPGNVFLFDSFYLIFGLKLMRPIGRYCDLGILVDETGRSPVEKLLSWRVLTGV